MEDMVLRLVAQQFHSAEVTGADSCVRRPLVATCSMDRTVHIWNVQDRSATPEPECQRTLPSVEVCSPTLS